MQNVCNYTHEPKHFPASIWALNGYCSVESKSSQGEERGPYRLSFVYRKANVCFLKYQYNSFFFINLVLSDSPLVSLTCYVCMLGQATQFRLSSAQRNSF